MGGKRSGGELRNAWLAYQVATGGYVLTPAGGVFVSLVMLAVASPTHCVCLERLVKVPS
jgi:hypothetical protein